MGTIINNIKTYHNEKLYNFTRYFLHRFFPCGDHHCQGRSWCSDNDSVPDTFMRYGSEGNDLQRNQLIITEMTNAEICLKAALKLRDEGKLNDWENNFVSQFEDWTKKQLRDLSYKQYVTLRKISDWYK